MFVYDDDSGQVGYTTSFMYSPMLQRHIALARVRPDLATPGIEVRLEIDVNHRYEYVTARTARLPLYNPAGRRPDMPKTSATTKPKAKAAPKAADRSAADRTYDAIVVGGGHNGLVNGAYLAKAGLKTLILERRPLVRRRGDHRGALPGLLVHDLLVRPEPAPAGHHPRPRADQARLHAAADVVDLRADGERRLPVARPGPRREPQGDRAPQQARRRRLQPVLARHGDGLPGDQAAARRGRRRTCSATTPRSCWRWPRSARGSGRWTSGRCTTPSAC